MGKYYKILIAVILMSFAWGSWWGYYRLKSENPENLLGPKVRWLGLKGVMPANFAKELGRNNHFQLVITEMNSENELLREALSHGADYDLIQLNSFISKSFLIDNLFLALDKQDISNFENISIDFRSLDYDLEDKYFLPISWGLNGFVVDAEKISLKEESLDELMGQGGTASLIPSPIELFNLAIKQRPIIKTWVETGQLEELRKTLREIKSKMMLWDNDPAGSIKAGSRFVAQMTNGQAAKLVGAGSKYRYVLPKERATLWVDLVGVSRGARDLGLVYKVLDRLLDAKVNVALMKESQQASVLKSSDTSDLPLLQKAAFIRNVPLSRVELFINREATEPTWLQAIDKEWGFTSKAPVEESAN